VSARRNAAADSRPADVADLDHKAGSHDQVNAPQGLWSRDDRRSDHRGRNSAMVCLDATEPLLGEPHRLDVLQRPE